MRGQMEPVRAKEVGWREERRGRIREGEEGEKRRAVEPVMCGARREVRVWWWGREERREGGRWVSAWSITFVLPRMSLGRRERWGVSLSNVKRSSLGGERITWWKKEGVTY